MQNFAPEQWIVIISIVSSAIVTILSGFLPLRIERIKQNREDKVAEEAERLKIVNEILVAQNYLLKSLVWFRSADARTVHNLSQMGSMAEIWNALLLAFHQWEFAIDDYLSPLSQSHEILLRLRTLIEKEPFAGNEESTNHIAPVYFDTVADIQTLTRGAIDMLKGRVDIPKYHWWS